MPEGATSARGLVLARVGAGHRLQGLLGIPAAARGWDLAFSVYDGTELTPADRVDLVHRYIGGKWDGIHAFFAANPERLAQHDLFWLVDDDIEVSGQQADALFAYVRSHGFELAQPALTHDSYYSHRLTLQCPGFRHRHTNFVELMLPVVQRHLLERVLPLCLGTRSGLGIDWVWHRYTRHPEQGVAIIDAIALPHRRPLNQHLRGRMRRAGIDTLEERRRLLAALGARRIYPVAFAGECDNGERVHSRLRMAARMMRAYWSVRRKLVRRPWSLRTFATFFLNQAFARVL